MTTMQSGALATVQHEEPSAIMHKHHHDVNTCSHFGHIYASALVVRCPHLERIDVTTATWMDHDAGDPIELYREIISYGPFDQQEEIMQWSGWAFERAVRVAQITAPHPNSLRIVPGSL